MLVTGGWRMWGESSRQRRKHGYRLKWSRGYKGTFMEHKVVPSAWISQSAKGNMVRSDTGEVSRKQTTQSLGDLVKKS